jgi:subtilisin family serine protease
MIGSLALMRPLHLLLRMGVALFAALTMASPAEAEQRFIVRILSQPGPLGASGATLVQQVCAVAGCTVRYPLDGALGEVFLVTTADGIDPEAFADLLSAQPVVANTEVDQVVRIRTTLAATASEVPPALYNRVPSTFFGTSVWEGYVVQPAAERVRVLEARNMSGLTGLNTRVAVIDTGIDTLHPAFSGVLVDGYDFTRNIPGGSERLDVLDDPLDQATWMVVQEEAEPAVLNQSTMGVVDQSTMGVVDQSTMGVVDGPDHSAFGHGTMVAGVIHMVAPEALIMPLKAFGSDGRGYSSDILRAVYYAVSRNAKVLNMSFSYAEPSVELGRAVRYAMSRSVLVVASAGNNGEHAAGYPAAIADVVGVASTDHSDVISSFSNYGEDLFWIAAPGEAVITTYPFGTYAAAWGTSFSAPFAAGTAALLAQQTPSIRQEGARSSLSRSLAIAGVACGRLDVVGALGGANPAVQCQP